MTRSASASHLVSDFDQFLFAPIGEERNGMLLSVLSALARQDADPWEEAAKLAGLPGETATKVLASLIAALPEGRSAYPDPGAIAARLIALLPRRDILKIPPRGKVLGAGARRNYRPAVYAIFINVILVACMIGAQFVVANPRPAAQVDDARAQAFSTVFP